MKLSHVKSSKIVGVAVLAGLWAIACSSDSGDNAATGGSTSAATGGKTGTGGTTAKTGGASSTSTAKTGGAPGTGGAATTAATGGTAPASTTSTGHTGGASAGGTSSTGTGTGTGVGGVGGTSVGGVGGVGGTTTTGGTSNVDAGDAGFTCNGCLKLFMPLSDANAETDSGQSVRESVEIDVGASTLVDLSSTVITAHIYVDYAGNAGGISIYAKDGADNSYAQQATAYTNLDSVTGWHDFTLDLASLAADAGTFDKSKIRYVGFNVNAGSSFTTAIWEHVTVYVDSITFTDNAHANYTFDTSVEGFAVNIYDTPTLDGSTVTWVSQ